MELKPVAACATCCCTLLVSIILLISAWSSLEIDEYGLDYASFSKTVDKDVYSEGRYFLGITHSFIRFPKTLQAVKFMSGQREPELKGRTSDGLLVELEASFQYKLLSSEIYDLYSEYGTNYRGPFMKMARAVLISRASNYTAYNFFSDRQKIATDMHAALKDLFTKELHATIPFFQLHNVNLPDKFEQAIQRVQIAAQTIARVRHERETVKVRSQTQIMQAQYQANITLMTANATARALLLQRKAEIDVFKYAQQTKAAAFSMLKNSTTLSNSQLLNFMKVRALSNHASDKLVIGVDGVGKSK